MMVYKLNGMTTNLCTMTINYKDQPAVILLVFRTVYILYKEPIVGLNLTKL